MEVERKKLHTLINSQLTVTTLAFYDFLNYHDIRKFFNLATDIQFLKLLNYKAMRILKTTITVLFTIYAFSMFGNGTNTETRDTFIVSNEIELDLMKSYVTIQVLKEINIKERDCFDDSNLNTFIQVLNNHLKKHPQTSLIVYTDEITKTIMNLINNNLEYKLASDRLIEKYHRGLIVDLKPTTKIAINH